MLSLRRTYAFRIANGYGVTFPLFLEDTTPLQGMTPAKMRTVSKECERDAGMMISMCKYYFNKIIEGH